MKKNVNNQNYSRININDDRVVGQSQKNANKEWFISKVDNYRQLVTIFYICHLFIYFFAQQKALFDDNAKEFEMLMRKLKESEIRELKTFESNLNLLCTAAKNCRTNICKYLLDEYGNLFGIFAFI
jgi:hypothetical protein